MWIIKNGRGDCYVEVAEIGFGSYSKVFKCRVEEQRHSPGERRRSAPTRYVAIKIIEPPKTRDLKNKLINEIVIHSDISHPNIVQLLDFNTNPKNGPPYIVMECCRETTLLDVFQVRRGIHVFEMRYYIAQVLNGLCFLHSKKIIHKDIKLQNLLLTEDMQLKIGDFGFSMKNESGGLVSGDYCGTRMYSAPEMHLKGEYSFSVDIWATGVSAFALLYGYYPFGNTFFCKNTEDINEAILFAGECNFPENSGSTSEVQIIKSMVNPDKNQRPTANDLLNSPYFKTEYIPKKLSELCISCKTEFIDNSDMPVKNLLSKLLDMLNEIAFASDKSDIDYGAVLPARYIKSTHLYKDGGIIYEMSEGSYGMHFNDQTVLAGKTNRIKYIENNAVFSIDPEKAPIYLEHKFKMYEVAIKRLRTNVKCDIDASPHQEEHTVYLQRFYQTLYGNIYLLSDGTVQFERKGEEIGSVIIIICPYNKCVTLVENNIILWSISAITFKKHGLCVQGSKYLTLMIGALDYILSKLFQ